jgi:hypothetical protein
MLKIPDAQTGKSKFLIAVIVIASSATTLARANTCNSIFKDEQAISHPKLQSDFWERLTDTERKNYSALGQTQGRSTIANLQSRVQEIVHEVELRSQYQVSPLRNVLISVSPRRNPVLKSLYDKGVIEYSSFTLLLSDKLVMSKVLEHYLQADFQKFHPKTVGLIEFLAANKLVDKKGQLIASRAQIAAAFRNSFPNGQIVKTATGWNSKGRNFLYSVDDIVSELFDKSSDLYRQEHFVSPLVSESLGTVLSGERWIVQEKIGDSEAMVYLKNPGKGIKEYRIHALNGRVIKGATLGRWPEQEKSIDRNDFGNVELFVQEFLNRLPLGLRQQQGWSFDIAEVRPGFYQIVEVNTNRGMAAHWSGWFQSPQVLGGLVRHMEHFYNWRFTGFSGALLRWNYGNYFRYKENTREHIIHNETQDNLLKESMTNKKDSQ